MIPTPILILGGEAGSGKDTVAALIQSYTKNTICIAQADPMKRFAAKVFGFTEHQLWGPSEARNQSDLRFLNVDAWESARYQIENDSNGWIAEVLPDIGLDAQYDAQVALLEWFDNVRSSHCLLTTRWCGSPTGLTPRYVLQTLGTEWGRKFSPLMWNDYAIRAAKQLLVGGYDYNRLKGVIKADRGVPDYVIITDGRFADEILASKMIGGVAIKIVNPNKSDDAKKVEVAGVKNHRSESELKMIPDHFYDVKLINDKSHGMLALENKVQRLVSVLKKFDVLIA
jgi:hypothetical protein